MPIKDILTILDLAGDQPAAKYALEFGRIHDAHVTGLAVSFEPVVPAFAAAPMPVDYMQAAHEQAIAAANEAKKDYDELARLAGVNNESRLAEILTGGLLKTSWFIADQQTLSSSDRPIRTGRSPCASC